MHKSTWLITGASSGLGLALAEHVLARGDAVTLAARSTTAMQILADDYPDTASRRFPGRHQRRSTHPSHQ